MSHAPVITIDGPSGVGKGTMAQLLAEKLGWHLLDSGALYRISGYAAHQAGIDLDAIGIESQCAQLARELEVEFKSVVGEEGVRVLLKGEDITLKIRTEEGGERASKVAVMPQVREALLQRQRGFAQTPGLVADGRDMGTTVFPDTPHKFFLTASAEERAQRRYKQLKKKGLDANLRALIEEISNRDQRDMTRSASPLRPAEDAVTIDTSSMSIDNVLDMMLQTLTPEFIS